MSPPHFYNTIRVSDIFSPNTMPSPLPKDVDTVSLLIKKIKYKFYNLQKKFWVVIWPELRVLELSIWPYVMDHFAPNPFVPTWWRGKFFSCSKVKVHPIFRALIWKWSNVCKQGNPTYHACDLILRWCNHYLPYQSTYYIILAFNYFDYFMYFYFLGRHVILISHHTPNIVVAFHAAVHLQKQLLLIHQTHLGSPHVNFLCWVQLIYPIF